MKQSQIGGNKRLKRFKMFKRLVRSSAIREDSPVRSSTEKTDVKGNASEYVCRGRDVTGGSQMGEDLNRNPSQNESECKRVSHSAPSDGHNVTLEQTDTSAFVKKDKHVKEEPKCDTFKYRFKRCELHTQTNPEPKGRCSDEHIHTLKESNTVEVDMYVNGDKVKEGQACCSEQKQCERVDVQDRSSGVLLKQNCIKEPNINRLTDKSDSLPERTVSCFTHPEIARVRSMGDVPMGTGAFYTGYIERQDSLRAVTVHEEDVPVIVRRRGCTLRVRITSFHEDGDEWIPVGRMILPIHVCTLYFLVDFLSIYLCVHV